MEKPRCLCRNLEVVPGELFENLLKFVKHQIWNSLLDPVNSFSKKMKPLLKVAFCQKNLEDFYLSQISRINIPFYYLKLLHPVHGIEKMSILKKITFTGLVYLQVQEVGLGALPIILYV